MAVTAKENTVSVQFDSPEVRAIRQKCAEVILNVEALTDAESVTAAMMLLSPLIPGLVNPEVNAYAWAASMVACNALLLDTLAKGLDMPITDVLRDVLDLDPGMS